MHLVLVRHGSAVRGGPWADADRPLLHEGERQAARAGRTLSRLGTRPARLWTSPAVRCRRTGEIIAAELGMERAQLRVQEELGGGVGAARILAALSRAAAENETPWWILVGHEPDLGALSQHLLAPAAAVRLAIAPGACLCLELSDHGSPATLRWALTPELLELAAGTPDPEKERRSGLRHRPEETGEKGQGIP